MDSYRHIRVEQRDGTNCIRLRKTRLDETDVLELGSEILDACSRDGCKNAALSLGPGQPECLYSVFLAKLVAIRNALRREGGELVLVEVSPIAYSVFEASLLDREFVFLPDFSAALSRFAVPPPQTSAS